MVEKVKQTAEQILIVDDDESITASLALLRFVDDGPPVQLANVPTRWRS
mgnify:CR=1 FL=1